MWSELQQRTIGQFPLRRDCVTFFPRKKVTKEIRRNRNARIQSQATLAGNFGASGVSQTGIRCVCLENGRHVQRGCVSRFLRVMWGKHRYVSIPKALPAFKNYERRDPVQRDFASFPEGIPLGLWHQRKKGIQQKESLANAQLCDTSPISSFNTKPLSKQGFCVLRLSCIGATLILPLPASNPTRRTRKEE